jgi:hypothetical protein
MRDQEWMGKRTRYPFAFAVPKKTVQGSALKDTERSPFHASSGALQGT